MKLNLALLALLFSLVCTSGLAQTTTDDFEDGDLLNPVWTGDNDDFVVTEGRLRLMAPEAGTSELGVKTPIDFDAETVTYEFLVDMDFAPSASNFAIVRLIDSRVQPEVREVEMKFGGISGSDDRLVVTFRSGSDEVGMMTGTLGALGSAPAIVRFRLVNMEDEWGLFADYAGGTDYALQAQTTVEFPISPDSLAINCRYTSTRADKFSFDDLNVMSSAVVDEDPPVLTGSEILSDDQVQLVFNEAIADDPAVDPANYTVSMAALTVTEATVTGNQLTLRLSGALPLREEVTIVAALIEDPSGNGLTNAEATFTYDITMPPNVDNLLINEFMADPNPVVGLPNAEYVELHNSSDTSVALNGIGVASGGSPGVYTGTATVLPGSYVVVTDNDDVADFSALGINAIGVDLPALTNGGDVISLVFDGQVLQEITYTDDWYNDPERNNGGYSIEYIGGADAGCSASWRASLDLAGGTPGRVNSVLGMSTDVTAPMIAEVEVGPFGITLTFNEIIDPVQFTPELFSISPALDLSNISFFDERTVFISADVLENQLYTLSILPDFSDCAGNFPGEAIELILAIPTQPEPGDVVVNEILFNPATGGSDFVELYNCSDKVFQVNGWQLINTASTSSTATQTVELNRLFLPGEHLTFTPDRDDIFAAFLNVDPNLLLEQRLPTLSDDDGNITVSVGGTVLDAFDYTEDFHSELLSPNDGVSLERLRYKTATQDEANWFSAASAENFGTPTRTNSQQRDGLAPVNEQSFSLSSPTFSPNGDSFEDFLELQYAVGQTGFLARVRIFDAQGRLVKTLRRTELLGTTGTLRWDGDNDEGRKAKAGLYVLYVELFNPDGDVREEKLVGVLAGER